MHYLDKLPRPHLGVDKTGWVRIKSANQPKVGQNSTGVDIAADERKIRRRRDVSFRLHVCYVGTQVGIGDRA
jgi:hypothetical protein